MSEYNPHKRVLSLLPGATEVLFSLEAGDLLVGRSHECDYPPEVQNSPICTEPKYDVVFGSGETDQRVRGLIREGLSVYRVDEERIKSLEPDIIITQDHCAACAVSYQQIEEAVDAYLDKNVSLVDFSVSNLSEFYESVELIAEHLDRWSQARRLIADMQKQFDTLRDQLYVQSRPDVTILEWLDPLMSSGNWLPVLGDIAGGRPVLDQPGSHAETISMNELLEADPDVLILAPCGYRIHDTREHLEELVKRQGWSDLTAVRNNEVYMVDGNQYFNRPGPRLTHSARIIAEILHPEYVEPTFHKEGWIRLEEAVSASA